MTTGSQEGAGNGILDVLLPFGGLKSPTWSSRGDTSNETRRRGRGWRRMLSCLAFKMFTTLKVKKKKKFFCLLVLEIKIEETSLSVY